MQRGPASGIVADHFIRLCYMQLLYTIIYNSCSGTDAHVTFHSMCHVLLQGNTTGDVYVYDTSDGKRMTHVAPIKVSAPVRACGLSPDCRHLLAVIGNGFIFRFEYRRPDAEV